VINTRKLFKNCTKINIEQQNFFFSLLRKPISQTEKRSQSPIRENHQEIIQNNSNLLNRFLIAFYFWSIVDSDEETDPVYNNPTTAVKTNGI